MAQPQAQHQINEHIQFQGQPQLAQPPQYQILDDDNLYHYSSSLDQNGRPMWSSFTIFEDKEENIKVFCADLQKINNLTSEEGLQRFNETRAKLNSFPHKLVIQVQSVHCQGKDLRFIQCQLIPEHGNPNHAEYHYSHNASTKKIRNQMAANAEVVYVTTPQ